MKSRGLFIGLTLLASAGLILIIIAVFTYRVDKSVLLNGQAKSYDKGWSYVREDESTVAVSHTMTNVRDNRGEHLRMRNRLPDINDSDACLLLRTYNQSVQVYIDGKMVYTFAEKDRRTFYTSPGSAWHMIPLYKDYSGKTIQMVYDSAYTTNVDTFGEVYIGDTSSALGTVMVGRFSDILLCVLIGILGAAMYIYSYMIAKLHKNYLGTLYLGIHATVVSCWSIIETGIVQIIYPNTSITELCSAFFFMLMPIPFLMHVFDTYFLHRRKICDKIGMGMLLLNGVCILVGVLNLVPFYYSFFGVYFLLMIILLVFIGIGIRDYTSTRDTKLLFFVVSTSILIVFECFDFKNFIVGAPADYSEHYRFGFVIYMAMITIYSYIRYGRYSSEYIERVALEKMAYEDHLTSCRNRLYFHNELMETENSLSQYHNVAIVMMDLNNLKVTNDVYGHSAGDFLIKECAAAVNKAFSGMGTLCRIGGDEFAMILRDVSRDRIKQSFSRMLEEVELYNYASPYYLEIAYGYAVFDAVIDHNMEDVMSRADKNMYICKRNMKENPIARHS